ncbi:MAG: hypothetical protein OK474_05925 [Thaumarchaeota archaeon]|nr:hypothetical protein [Nitrososphaerota archaeon]
MIPRENREDLPFLLFLVPFAVSAVYAIFLWVQTGVSATLPQTVFLQVTENPYVFLIGFVAVIVGVVMDVAYTEPALRRAKLVQESKALQIIAITALVLGILSAWYAAGFDLGVASTNILTGRYVIIFPALLIAFSFLMLPAVNIRKDQTNIVLIAVMLLAIPLVVDEVGKRSFFAGMLLGLGLLVAAIYLYLGSQVDNRKKD